MAEEKAVLKHIVKPGDRMSKIAHSNDHNKKYADYHALYAAQSEEIQDTRPNPEELLPGDEIVLPEITEEKHKASDKKAQQYIQDTELPELKILIKALGEPLAGKDFEVFIDTEPYTKKAPYTGKGTTDGKGFAKFRVAPDVTEVKLTFKDPAMVFLLKVGYLHPIGDGQGVEQRLNNLGYYTTLGPAAAPANSAAEKKAQADHAELRKKALARFQENTGQKKLDGSLDNDMRKALLKAHEPPEK